MTFNAPDVEEFKSCYPGKLATLRHDLIGHPLFEITRLTQLAGALPSQSVEYNAGDLPVSQDPAKTPMNGLSAEETVRRIAENNSWMVLKNIEQDAEYNEILNACLGEIEPTVRPATGVMYKREGFVFVSSPGAVTPFHMDPEHNILMQLRGTKTFRAYPDSADAIITDEQHEAFYGDRGHRNLPYREEFEKYAQAFEMTPGDALYVPVKTPHWVRVGDDVSISLSITWRSNASDREARLRLGNAWLRAKGLHPPAPGASPLRDGVVVFARRVTERLAR
jgi:hypothetical protein